MKIKHIITYILLLLAFTGFSQKATISGFVSDQESGEQLLGSNVYEKETIKGVASNSYGFYSLTLDKGQHTIIYSFVGYQPKELKINLTQDTVINVTLSETLELSEVEIRGDRAESKVQSSQMSITTIPIKTIQNLPVLLGEVDIIKTIQLLPGVQSGREGSSGLYVRGGGPDQNLVLLDGVPVYNVNHLFGFFSVFNADAVNSVSLIKGGFPARYGGRLSSVLDIRMREGNMKEFRASGSVGLISSRLTVEGPIIKDKSSFIISGRRTYLDILAQPIILLMGKVNGLNNLRAGYYFYDLNGKINYKFSDKSRLFVSSYMGNDEFYSHMKEVNDERGYKESYNVDLGLGWGNITTSARWNYILNNKLFSNSTLIYSKYQFKTENGFKNEFEDKITGKNTSEEIAFGYKSGIDDIGLKLDFDYTPIPEHNIKFGISSTYHTYNPGVSILNFKSTDGIEEQGIDTTLGSKTIYAWENDIYVEDDFEFGGIFKANVGVHYSSFFVRDKQYHSVQPRLALRALVTDKWSWKAAYSQMTQYVHLLTNSNIGLPTDLWVPVTNNLKPMYSEQYAAGTVYEITDEINLSVEGYYKTMRNLVEYKEGASFLSLQDDWEQKVVQGDGYSYGLEVLLQKDVGNTTGWIGYTLSWTERQFDDISFGAIFPYKYDRRHDLSVVVTHKFSDNFNIGASWVFGSGYASTLPLEQYQISPVIDNPLVAMLGNAFGGYYGGNTVDHIETRNNFRMPSYHRMDIGVNFPKETSWGKRTWSFGVYNAYGRSNPYFLMMDSEEYFEGNGQQEEKKVLKQISLLPAPIPFVTFKFEFNNFDFIRKLKNDKDAE